MNEVTPVEETLAAPAKFVVGRNGCVKAGFVDPDFRRRMQTEDILTAVAENRR